MIDRATIDDLRSRLGATRWVDDPPDLPRSAGTDAAYLRAFAHHWEHDFSFDDLNYELASHPHSRVEVDGQRIHVLHARSPHAGATPLLITHGWPSSFLEFTGVLDALTTPERHGGTAADAFDVVVPSLPGFVFSGPPKDLDGYTAERIADTWATVMTALGYPTFLASGADIGSRVTGWLAVRHARRVRGIHVSTNVLQTTIDAPMRPHRQGPLSAEERAWLAGLGRWDAAEGAYEHLQRTKPATLAPALQDSPVGLASWLIEKWLAWAPSLEPGDRSTLDLLARHTTLYWATGSILRSFLPYLVYDRGGGGRPDGPAVQAPVALFVSEHDIGGVPPRSFVERRLDLVQWTEFTGSGHFPAVEQPGAFVVDLRTFANSLRHRLAPAERDQSPGQLRRCQ